MKLKVFITFSIIFLSFTSCATKSPDDRTKETIKKTIETPDNWSVKTVKNNKALPRWVESFNDPILKKFIEEGKANNSDIQIAANAMDKAWLLAKKSGASLKPTAELSLGGTQVGQAESSPADPNVSVGLQVSWELDVWGRLRSGIKVVEAQAQAARADYIFAQHSLSANISKTYFKVIDAMLQNDIARKNLEILKRTMYITKVKYDNGKASAQDLALNQVNLAIAKEQLITLEGSARDATRALEVLLGRYPDAKTEIPSRLPDLPPSPPAGVPSEILERRPDLVSAERQIAAAFNATDQAQAARLPRFSLTSSVSGSSDSLANVLNPTNIAWQLGTNLVAPLFDGGRRKIDIKIATEEQKQSIANYVKKALTAFSEVEKNLDQGRILAERKKALKEALNQSTKAYRIAKLRYDEGESDLFDTMQIQQQFISAESKLLSIKRNQLEQRVNLYLSLGGSW